MRLSIAFSIVYCFMQCSGLKNEPVLNDLVAPSGELKKSCGSQKCPKPTCQCCLVPNIVYLEKCCNCWTNMRRTKILQEQALTKYNFSNYGSMTWCSMGCSCGNYYLSSIAHIFRWLPYGIQILYRNVYLWYNVSILCRFRDLCDKTHPWAMFLQIFDNAATRFRT